MKITDILYIALMISIAFFPVIMFLLYANRRLKTRQRSLMHEILTLNLGEEYMQIRHGQDFYNWNKEKDNEKKKATLKQYFYKDFHSELNSMDYIWPVLLTSVIFFTGISSLYDQAIDVGEQTQGIDYMLWGFTGSCLISMLTLMEEFTSYSLFPRSFHKISFRILFASTASYLVSSEASAITNINVSLLSFAVGLMPYEKLMIYISKLTRSKLMQSESNKEIGLELKSIQGLEEPRERKRMVEIGITSIQALATSDPLTIFFRTTFPLRTIVDMQDKAILFLYLGDRVISLRKHGINGIIELVSIARLMNGKPAFEAQSEEEILSVFKEIKCENLIDNISKTLDMSRDELMAFIYNMHYDPVVIFLSEVWGKYMSAGKNQKNLPLSQ